MKFLAIFSFALGVLALVVAITSAINYQSNRSVCKTTKQQPAMVAVVDPKTGQLFAVPALLEVCTDVDNK